MSTKEWNTSNALATSSNTSGLVLPYNVPRVINVLVRSNQKVLLGAISIDNLRSKNLPGVFSGQLIVNKTEDGRSSLIAKQSIEIKANRPAMSEQKITLSTPIVIEPEAEYRLRFVFDHSWAARTFYCLTKINDYDTKIDANTTITLSPEKVNGDVLENELPLILYFNKL